MRLSPFVSTIFLFPAVVLSGRTAVALEFPFEAAVIVDEAVVRSGTGGDEADYSTMLLKRGDRVQVLHQEFGGWFKIAPPEGSFSWIREDLIDRNGAQGIVREDTMDVIGSEVGTPGFEVRNLLRKGEVVQILSAAEGLNRGPRPTSMLRIRPPRGEFRYIRQRDVVPADQLPAEAAATTVRAESGPYPTDVVADPIHPLEKPQQDPFSGGLQASQPLATATGPELSDGLPGGAAFELARTASGNDGAEQPQRLPESATDGIAMTEFGFQAPGPADPTYAQLTDEERKQVDAAWKELKSLDLKFRQMRQKPIVQWQLPALKQSYEQLRQTPDGFIRRQIERRLAGLDRYERVYREFHDVQTILRQTEVRDEQIRQSYLSQRQTRSTGKSSRTLVSSADPGAAASAGAPVGRIPAQSTASFHGNRQARSPVAAAQPFRRQSRQFDGAGIIQRTGAVRSGIRHVLLAPDGRILAYLQGVKGVNLDRFVGQSMGLTGPRQFRRDLGADFLVVRQLTPVQLVTGRTGSQ